ncbi:MAG: bifunctional riboflavin kinase/FAD synthetase [Ignavibacteria bacterium]|nr:bifunctional riboflavin kinase/FAD synthetase [Ignavibacteria bacterium]
MNIVRDLNTDTDKHDRKYFNPNSIVTVGTFDGLHLGHKKILDTLVQTGDEKNLRKTVVTFEPHPRLILKKNGKYGEVKILTTFDEKILNFESQGIDTIFVINFTKEFAATPATEFFLKYLINKIGFSHYVVGYDHMFGKNREGSIVTIKSLSEEYKFDLWKVDEFKLNNHIVSSTLIRRLLLETKVKEAAGLLGRNYTFTGKISYGDKRGSIIGFPTANIETSDKNKLIPGNGVYLVKVYINNNYYFGMMNIGSRPTVTDDKNIFLEIHILDFSNNIYGEIITVEFIDFIRNEKKFSSLEELKIQLNKDKQTVLEKTLLIKQN